MRQDLVKQSYFVRIALTQVVYFCFLPSGLVSRLNGKGWMDVCFCSCCKLCTSHRRFECMTRHTPQSEAPAAHAGELCAPSCVCCIGGVVVCRNPSSSFPRPRQITTAGGARIKTAVRAAVACRRLAGLLEVAPTPEAGAPPASRRETTPAPPRCGACRPPFPGERPPTA